MANSSSYHLIEQQRQRLLEEFRQGASLLAIGQVGVSKQAVASLARNRGRRRWSPELMRYARVCGGFSRIHAFASFARMDFSPDEALGQHGSEIANSAFVSMAEMARVRIAVE